MSSESSQTQRSIRDSVISKRAAMRFVHGSVYILTALLGLSLLSVGTVALIAELKGTWHWMIHLDSTISYMAVFTSYLLVLLVPLLGLSLYGHWRWDDG